MKTVFISYSSEDKSFAEKLAADLKNLGVGIWFDRWEMNVGDSIVEKINKGIRENDYLGVVLSPASVESDWVKKELNAAIMKEIEQKSVFILPILYKKCQVPPLLQDKVYANFVLDYDEGLRAILNSLLPRRSDNGETLNKQLAKYYIQKAREYEGNKQFEEAFGAYETATGLCPEFDDAYFHYGVTKIASGQIQEAKKLLEKALLLNPGHQDALFNLGSVAGMMEDYPLAISSFARLIERGVKDFYVYRQLGNSYLENREFASAINPLRDAIVLAPNPREYAAVCWMLHIAYRMTENLGCALAYFEEFVLMTEKMGMDELDYYLALSDNFLVANIHEKAVEYLHKAMAVHPNDDRVQQLSLKIDKYAKAYRTMGVRSVVNNPRAKYEGCRINLLRMTGKEDLVSMEISHEGILPMRVKWDKSS